jgi:hypothetical protein
MLMPGVEGPYSITSKLGFNGFLRSFFSLKLFTLFLDSNVKEGGLCHDRDFLTLRVVCASPVWFDLGDLVSLRLELLLMLCLLIA